MRIYLLRNSLAILLCAMLSVNLAHAEQRIGATGWSVKNFVGATQFNIADNGVITARCDHSSSALYNKQRIDLTKTPILAWEWRLDAPYAAMRGDEKTKAADDFVARLYVVTTGTGIVPKPESLNYVWSRDQKNGTRWTSPYHGKTILISMEKGQKKGVWVKEQRDIRTDFKRFLGRDLAQIDGVALMSDCDNMKTTSGASYRNIRFLPAQ